MTYNNAGMESGYSNEVSKTIAIAPTPPKSLCIWILQALIWLGQHLKFWAWADFAGLPSNAEKGRRSLS